MLPGAVARTFPATAPAKSSISAGVPGVTLGATMLVLLLFAWLPLPPIGVVVSTL